MALEVWSTQYLESKGRWIENNVEAGKRNASGQSCARVGDSGATLDQRKLNRPGRRRRPANQSLNHADRWQLLAFYWGAGPGLPQSPVPPQKKRASPSTSLRIWKNQFIHEQATALGVLES